MVTRAKFVSPTNLHCSQTPCYYNGTEHRFVSPTNLHCSQTLMVTMFRMKRLFPLRIYTALKQHAMLYRSLNSLFPLRIYTALKRNSDWFRSEIVCFPYEFTLLSNIWTSCQETQSFVSPTNLHCSQTIV